MKTLDKLLRPRNFGQLIGQRQITKAIARQMKSKREPSTWLLHGETGSGKTTLARILALSLQCTHAEFGFPCIRCRKNKSTFNIEEINASRVNKVEDMEKILEMSSFAPMAGRRRVFILDEAQRISAAAQNLLLKDTEEPPRTTVYIICTTEPGKLLKTLRGRCVSYELRKLQADGVRKLIVRAAEKIDYKKSSGIDEFESQVLEQGMQSPRLILMAFEKFVSGTKAEEAVASAEANVNVLSICRAATKGDLETVHDEMRHATTEDARILRERLAMYMNTMLLDELGPGEHLTWGITSLAHVSTVPEGIQLPYTNAVLHQLARRFGGGKSEDASELD